MRIGSTIIVVILAIVGVVAVLRTGWKSESQRKDAGVHRLLTSSQLPVDDLTRITLKRGQEPALLFERDGAKWRQIEPFVHPLDLYSIRRLAQAAQGLEVADAIEPAKPGDGVSHENLSLQPPAAAITFQWPGGSLTLHLGRRSVAGRAYLQISGDENIYVVNQKLHEAALDEDPKEWRDRTIFENAGVESARIEWNNGPAKMALARQRKQWMMIEPATTRVEPAALDQYLDAIGRAAVSGFILDQPSERDLAKFGLVNSPVALTISDGQGKAQRLIIGARAGGATQDFFGMLEGRPAVVRLSGAVLAALFRQPQELAALTASGVVPADVKSIAIRNGGEEVRLERDLEKWRTVSAEIREANPARVQELLHQLTQLRASSVEFREYPHDLEIATITLHGFDGRAIDTVRVVEEKGQIAMENGDNVLRIYPAGLKLRLNAADFGF